MPTTIASLALSGLITLASAGGQSAGTRPTATLRSGDPSVVCEKCKTTWTTKTVRNDKGVPVARTKTRNAVCPECRSAARRHLVGRAAHGCKSCGGRLTSFKPTRPNKI